MYKEYRKELDKFLDYKGSLDTRIAEFKQSIADKESKLEELKENFTQDFISGKGADDKQLKKIRQDIQADKEQLYLIEQATKNNIQLKELGNLVYKEYRALEDKKNKDRLKDREEVEKLEQELKQKKQNILDKQNKRESIINEYTRLRKQALDYMDINNWEKASINNIY